MNNFFKKFWALIILVVLVLGIGWWQSRNLNDYSIFRADQARDAYLVKKIHTKGWGYAKLLGPKAGAAVQINEIKGAFKLGPLYTYEQYLGTLFSKEVTAESLLFVDRILSLLSIVLFYFLLRNFFNKKISISSTILFATSYFLTIFSHFAWNINQIVFWELLFAIVILKILEIDSSQNKSKNNKQKSRLFLLLIFTLSILGQLHILSAVAFTFIGVVLWLIYRPKISWKYYLGGLGIILFLYSPMIISDIYNKGDNLQRFFSASKVEKHNNDNLYKKFTKLSLYHGKNYLLILTGLNKYDFKKIAIFGDWFIVFSLILIRLALFKRRLLGISHLPQKLIKQINKMFKLNHQQKQFLILISFWFFISFLIYWRILPRLHKPRYWLMIAPLPFVFLAFWFYVLDRLGSGEYKFWNRYITNSIIAIISGLILFSNLTAINLLFKSLKSGQPVSNKFHKKITLGPYRDLTTYSEMKNIVDYLQKKNKAEHKPAICFKSLEYQNKLGFQYILDKDYPDLPYLQTSEGNKYDCSFFVITKTSRGQKELHKIKGKYQAKKLKTFKSLTVWQLKGINAKIKKQDIVKKPVDDKEDKRVIYWKDLKIISPKTN